MSNFRSLIRASMSPRGKRIVSGLIAGNLAGALIRQFSRGTIKHRGTRVRIDHRRIPNHMVGALFWSVYERAEADQITQFLPPNRDVVELGASAGINTVLIARLLDTDRRVFAVEADPELAELAKDNCLLNQLQNKVFLISAAIHYDAPQVIFSRGLTPVDGRLQGLSAETGEDDQVVPALKLSTLVQKNDLKNFTLVMDIEGAEWGILMRHEELQECDMIIAELHETHVADRKILVSDMLHELTLCGFQIIDQYGVCVVAKRTSVD